MEPTHDDRSGDHAVSHGSSDRINEPGDESWDGLPIEWEELVELADGEAPDNRPRRIGRFTIERELGRGGLGVVFLAHDPVLNRPVALKLPRIEVLLSPLLRARFDREGAAAAQLTHPNLATVFEVGHVGPISYIVTAYCAGLPLVEWLHQQHERHGQWCEAHAAAAIVLQLSEAVQYAHTQGVLHRDIKPSNVILESPPADRNIDLVKTLLEAPPWIPKLVDFGLARVEGAAQSDTRSGQAMGSLGYMSPEQAEGRQADIGPASDVYGLGTVLYELLTGRGPFAGLSEVECLRRMVDEDPPRPSQFAPEVPRDLEAICLKCLEKSPVRRYESAAALTADLRQFLTGQPTVARPLGFLVRSARWAQRKPWIAALSVATLSLLVLVAAVSSFAAWRISRERNAAQHSAAEALYAERAANEALLQATIARKNESDSRKVAEKQAAEARRQAQIARQETARAKREATTSNRLAVVLSNMFQGVDPTGLGGFGVRLRANIGRDLTSRELLERAVELVNSRALADEEPIVRARLLARLSQACRLTGMFEACDQLSAQAVAALERAGDDVTEGDQALVKQARGFSIADLGQLEQAEQLLREAVAHAITARQQGQLDDLDVADVKFDLSWVLADRVAQSDRSDDSEQDFVESEQLIREVLDIRRRDLGDAHPQVATTATAFCLLLLTKREDAAANEFMLKEVLPIYAAQAEGERFSVAMQSMFLGYVARQAHDLDKAVRHYAQAINIVEESGQDPDSSFGLSANHPAMMVMWGELASTYRENGQFRAAEKAILRVVEISDRILPNGHWRLSRALVEYAGDLGERRDYAAQEKVARRALDIAQHYREVQPAHLCGPLLQLVRAAAHAHENEQFAATLDECLDVLRPLKPRSPAAIATCLATLADDATRGIARERSSAILRKVTAAAEELLVDDASDMGTVYRSIASVWTRLGAADAAQQALDRDLRLEVPAEEQLDAGAQEILSQIVAAELAADQVELAEQHALRLLAQTSDEHRFRARQHAVLGLIALQRNDLDATLERYRQAVHELLALTPRAEDQLISAYGRLAFAELLAEQAEACDISLREAVRYIRAGLATQSESAETSCAAAEVIATLALLARRVPSKSDDLRQVAKQATQEVTRFYESFDPAAAVEQQLVFSHTLRSCVSLRRTGTSQFLTAEERETWDRSLGAQAAARLQSAIETADEHGRAFPRWRVRWKLDAELGWWLSQTHQFEQAEKHLLAALTRIHESVDERHVLATEMATLLAEFYSAWNKPAEAEKYRALSTARLAEKQWTALDSQ